MNNDHTTPKLTEEELSQVIAGFPNMADVCDLRSVFKNHNCDFRLAGKKPICATCPGNPNS